MSTAKILKHCQNAPELTKETYLKCCRIFRMSLNTHNLQEYIPRRMPELTPVDEKCIFKLSPQQLDDSSIKSALLQLVPEDVYYIIEDLPTAFKMWNAIAAYYQPNSEACVDGLIKEFRSFNLEPGANVDECATELTKLQSKIASSDPSRRPSDLSTRNHLLDHFETESNGFHNETVIPIELIPENGFQIHPMIKCLLRNIYPIYEHHFDKYVRPLGTTDVLNLIITLA